MTDAMRIIAVALKMPDGRVEWAAAPILRHGQLMSALREMGQCLPGDVLAAEQGFATEDGTFLSRREAFDLAAVNGQLKRKPGGYDGPELFSEDLW